MNAFQFLFNWYNFPFLVALGCCLFFAFVQLIGGFSDNDGDPDLDTDLDLMADVDGDIDTDLEADAGAGRAVGVLGWLGIGQVPLVLVLMALLGSFGFIGLLTSTLLIETVSLPVELGFAIALLVALVLGFFGGGVLSRAFGRVVGRSSLAVSNEQLVGRAGVVVSASVSPSYGRVAVRDSQGTMHTVFAVVEGGTNLPERAEVAITRYDASQRRFVVRALR
jgi:membrane protein implicated in regulation of membrane protease activity